MRLEAGRTLDGPRSEGKSTAVSLTHLTTLTTDLVGRIPLASALSSERGESAKQRADRRWGELMQEVRVAQMGVQILLGFLLGVAFTERFAQLGAMDRGVYVVTVVLGSAAAGTLIAPVALHRFVTGHRMKHRAVEWASRLIVTGLVLLLCTVTCALLLLLHVVLDGALAWWIVGALFLWFVACWFLLPAWARRTGADRP